MAFGGLPLRTNSTGVNDSSSVGPQLIRDLSRIGMYAFSAVIGGKPVVARTSRRRRGCPIPDFKPAYAHVGSRWYLGRRFSIDLRFTESINLEGIDRCALSHCFFCSGRYSAVRWS